MPRTCRKCQSERVVPVLDVRMKRANNEGRGGNPYRQRCLGCESWLPATSTDHFENHPDPHVLPPDTDPDEHQPTTPAVEWDDPEALLDVKREVENRREARAEQEADEPDPSQRKPSHTRKIGSDTDDDQAVTDDGESDDTTQTTDHMDSQEAIRQQAQSGTNDQGDGGLDPDDPSDDGAALSGDGNGGGGGGGPLSGVGLTRRQGLLLAIVVVVALTVYLKSQDGDSDGEGGGKASEEIDAALGEEFEGEVAVRPDDDADEPELVVPSNPDNPLDADAAVIEGLKANGKLGGGE